jgi:hypothetical protein
MTAFRPNPPVRFLQRCLTLRPTTSGLCVYEAAARGHLEPARTCRSRAAALRLPIKPVRAVGRRHSQAGAHAATSAKSSAPTTHTGSRECSRRADASAPPIDGGPIYEQMLLHMRFATVVSLCSSRFTCPSCWCVWALRQGLPHFSCFCSSSLRRPARGGLDPLSAARTPSRNSGPRHK